MSTDHWEIVWSAKQGDEVSWYQPDAQPCGDLVRRVSSPSAHVAVIGAGRAALIVDLLDHGYTNIVAVDIAAAALGRLREYLGDRSDGVEYLTVDMRTVSFAEPVDVWHDRAAFHFLTDAEDQALYASAAAAAVSPGGHLVIATFAPTGPEQCSGLDVARHSAESLSACFNEAFDVVEAFEHTHVTPWESSQRFTHALLQRR